MGRTRTTKKLAQRIDLNYFKRPTRLKRAKLWLSILLPLLALVWIAERSLRKDSRVYSSGHMSEPHAVLEKECAACHLQQAGAFSAKATDSACLACHDAPEHHQVHLIGRKELACAECHTEHRGRVNISAASNQACVECHSNLRAHSDQKIEVGMLEQTRGGSDELASPQHISRNLENSTLLYTSRILNFEEGHPEFASVRDGAKDPSAIKLDHAIHMKPIRRGPNGPMVQLECSDCHRPDAVPAPTTYSDANYVGARVSYVENHTPIRLAQDLLAPRRPETGRERMTPVKFATACASCHLLTFDKRFDEGVPHDTPEVVDAFLIKKLTEYIATHPAELREVRDPSRDLTGIVLQPIVRVFTPRDWVAAKLHDAEELLWRKTCNQCHTLARGSNQNTLPHIAEARTTVRWLPHAKFDHDAHRGFSCVSCHEMALKSTASSDVLVPGIRNCQTCHAPGPGYAESRCFECHTYHDWSKRKELAPKFMLPALQHGGQ